MKITVDIDCTPQEARAFFGLPDLEPLQEELVKELQRQLKRNLERMDPETAIKEWLPVTLQGFDDMRRMFGGALSNAFRGTSARATAKSPDRSSRSRGAASPRRTTAGRKKARKTKRGS